jgi:hypothetical protein
LSAIGPWDVGSAEIWSKCFGHKLMKEMGWSKVMAVGDEAEGVLVPVEEAVRSAIDRWQWW